MFTRRIRRIIGPVLLLAFIVSTGQALADENLLSGGDFENGLTGWGSLWTRTPGGKVAVDEAVKHAGQKAVRIEHTGGEDWSFPQVKRIDVKPGEIFELSAWVRVEGDGDAILGVVLYDEEGDAADWSFGGVTARATNGWRQLRTRFVIPNGGAQIWPRLIGYRPATVWMDDAVLVRAGSLDKMRSADLPPSVAASNDVLEVTFDTAAATFSLADRRTGKQYRGLPAEGVFVLDAKPVEHGLELRLLDAANMLELTAVVTLNAQRPEVLVELEADGDMPRRLAFPGPFATAPGDLLIMPVNEGISYPVDDQTLGPMRYHLFGGHGLSMGWWGVTGGVEGMMAVVETPDDAAVRVPRIDGRLALSPEWLSQKGRFGPARRIRYVLFDSGGHVAMCKRYRQHSQEVGLFRTLAQKREENPDVDLLVGAVNVWCWSREPVDMCRKLQSLGIERILWSHRSEPEAIRAMNEMGVLTSRYDIYQDCMNPANFPKLRGVHGDWRRGWRVLGKDGRWYPCGVLCDRVAPAYAKRRVPPELETHPYRGRFIDTTTASPWRECYHPDHPLTRSESRRGKMELLRYMSGECGLVTGSETGHEAAVPYLHFFEGMMSLGPYRVPDAGRHMQDLLDDVPERVARFQTGHFYRLPLWELVYHDCVVPYWYWGDYNNKLPSLWDRRDLWNALYGTPPMFMFNDQVWRQYRDRFVQSYRTATPVARATGYSEMLSHRWLTDDHAVQETRFAGGVTVTVNFGDASHTLPDGFVLRPLSHRIEGL